MTQREARGGPDTQAPAASEPAAGSSANGTAAARDGVISAFVLGWHMAELFHADVPRSSQPRQANLDKLAGIGDLSPLSQARLLSAQVQADLRRIWRLDDPGRQAPDLGPVQTLLEADKRQPGQLPAAVAALHQQLLMTLTAADFRLGKAYGLGRALAETAMLPDAGTQETVQRQFARYRLANLLGWLADLKSVFPPHAAEAVRGSLEAWTAWSHDPILRSDVGEERLGSATEEEGHALGTAPSSAATAPAPPTRRARARWWFARRPGAPQGRSVVWDDPADRESVTRALHRQGELWRAVLSGEKACVDLLSADDYVGVADRLLGHLRHLTLQFLRRFWITSTVVVGIVVAATATVVLVQAVSTVVAAILTAAGAIGLTWKGVASGLGRVLQQAQRPLWESELDVAVASALTRTPRERRAARSP